MIGTQLAERYSVERELGRGGMAVVLLARDEQLNRPVAVKLLAEHLLDEPELRERFLREARIAARLLHPRVVAVYDTGEVDGRPYILMEYVDGETLAERLAREGALRLDEAAPLLAQACEGIAHAHAHGVVHRDVKPGNLLVDRGGATLKVTDFGIARAAFAAGHTEVGTILGTAAYLAPEVVAGEAASAASDVYALGATLYETLAGRPPRPVQTLADLAAPGPPESLSRLVPDLPPRLVELVHAALDDVPARRPAPQELADALQSRVTPRPAPAATAATELVPPPARVRPRCRRVPALLAAAVVLAALAVAAALALGDGDDPAARPQQTPVEPVRSSGPPEQDARDLAAWLRANAGSR